MNIFRTMYRIVKFRMYELTGRPPRIEDWVIEDTQEMEPMYGEDLEAELIKAIEAERNDGP